MAYDYKEMQKNITTYGSDVNLLHPIVKDLALKFLEAFKNEPSLKDYTVKITQTLRNTAYQNTLYAKGRTTPGPKVTNASGGNSMHEYGLAFDIAIMKNGVYMDGTSNLKGIPQYNKAGELAKKIGLFWGGDFKSIPDAGHFQFTGKYDNNTTLSLLKSGKSSDFILGV